MLGFRIARLLAGGAVVVVLASALGCPSSGEKPAGTETKQASAEEPGALAKVAAGEFQQPPTLPPSDPPPKLSAEVEDGLNEVRTYKGGQVSPPIFNQDIDAFGNEQGPSAKAVTPAGKVGKLRDEPAALPAKDATSAKVATPEEDAASEKDAPPARLKKVVRKPFNPIEENGKYFEGWPKPKAAIAITGLERGYIEPCGCAGLDRMTGGMSRRYTLLQDLRKKGWPLVTLDVGDLAKGFGREAEIKFRTLVEGKEKMGYNAVGFGPEDLRLPPAELVSVAAEVNGKPSVFVSANVGLFGFDQNVTQTSRIVKAGGMRIGVTAILGKQYQKNINTPEIELIDPEVALKKIVPELKRKADYLVLLANSTRAEVIELLKKFPDFNAVVVAEGAELPPHRPELAPGTKTLLVTVGHKGMSVIVLGLFDGTPSIRYQRVLLDSRFDHSADTRRRAAPEMKRLMAGYQEQLKLLGFAELVGERPSPHPLAEQNGRFVGSQRCEACHEISYDIWKRSLHAQAYKTLVELDPPRNFDPECVSCHVVGWHPTKYFPYKGGFESIEKMPRLKGVGCEDCHGPGENHCKAEDGHDEALKTKYRKAVVITKAQLKKEQCSTCHDLDNSPEFNFDKYWPLVEHYEKK